MRDFSEDDLSNIRLVVSDMDFTLLKNDKSMPAGIFERIHALADAGICFAAASGRASYTLEKLFGADASAMGLIADNGGVVSHQGKTIFVSRIEEGVQRELVEHSCERDDLLPIVCGITGARALSSAAPYDDVIHEFYRNLEYVESPDELLGETAKFTVFVPNGNSREVFEQDFNPRFGDLLSVTCGGDYWIDVMNKGVTKGTGLKRLAEWLGIDLADVAAFGDTDNDVPLLSCAGHSFLVENADRRMEKYADFSAPSNEDEGVLAVIDAILAAQR